jgi:TRAP-type C4-dicarboxylate transport system substrate-binding protein
MNTTLDIHHLSITQIDSMIDQTWNLLSEEEQQIFQSELSNADTEYLRDIQQLIDTKLV